MRTVYVESSFVLQLALQEAAEAVQLLDIAGRGDVRLAIPWVALFEPFYRLRAREGELKNHTQRAQQLVRELTKTVAPLHGAIARRLHEGTLDIEELIQEDRRQLANTLSKLMACVEVLPPSAETLALGYEAERKGLSSADAIVFVAVLQDAKQRAADAERLLLALDQAAFVKNALVLQDLKAAEIQVISSTHDLVARLTSVPLQCS